MFKKLIDKIKSLFLLDGVSIDDMYYDMELEYRAMRLNKEQREKEEFADLIANKVIEKLKGENVNDKT